MSSLISRREFLSWISASTALAAFDACTRLPQEPLFSRADGDEKNEVGRRRQFATSLRGGIGVLVGTYGGRPIKIDGNPDHPSSLGKSDAVMQTVLMDLYDPRRAGGVRHRGLPSRIEEFSRQWESLPAEGLRLLVYPQASPTLSSLYSRFQKRYPGARIHVYDPLEALGARQATRAAFGVPSIPIFRFDQARTIVSLGSDFLTQEPGHIRYAADYMKGRESGSRLFVAESAVSPTGALADDRLALRPSQLPCLALGLASRLGVEVPPSNTDSFTPWIDAAAAALKMNGGVVIAGERQPDLVHALAIAINQRIAAPVSWIPAHEECAYAGSLAALISDLNAGKVSGLVILDGNPAYDAFADLDFQTAILRAPFRARIGRFYDETSSLCDWHLPLAHELETWGDVLAHDGGVGFCQPILNPLHGAKSVLGHLRLLLGDLSDTDRLALRKNWPGLPDEAWSSALRTGYVSSSSSPHAARTKDFLPELLRLSPVSKTSAIELNIEPDPWLRCGMNANNSWLQELPRPISRLTWDNAAQLDPKLAAQLKIQDGDILRLASEDKSIELPALIVPGHAEQVISVALGFGRRGVLDETVGVDVFPIRTSGSPYHVASIAVTRTGGTRRLALSQLQASLEGRDPARVHEAGAAVAAPAIEPSLLSSKQTTPGEPAWGMSIDLSRCIGCAACVSACQAENNIPSVGRSEVLRGREMHWLRIDRYYSEDRVLFQPLACVHCETAPCELVCPTGATNHSTDGLNQMVYNRCVGTRYCSNNCPYKVRRFNFFAFSEGEHALERRAANPEVTIRSRGVMEKCTYCIQRIQAAKIQASREHRRIRDGEVVTACQQACPTEAIVFGDLADPTSRASELRGSPLSYSLLGELGTRPRTTYLARVVRPKTGVST